MAGAIPDNYPPSNVTASIVKNAILVFSAEGVAAIVIIAVMFLVLIIIFLVIACKFKPWRLFLSTPSPPPRTSTIKSDDLERPLISEDPNPVYGGSTRFTSQEADQLSSGDNSSSWPQGPNSHQRLPSTAPQLKHSDSFVLEISETEETVGQTLKRPLVTNQGNESHKSSRKEDSQDVPRSIPGKDSFQEFIPKFKVDQRSILILEVVSGPSRGTRFSVKSSDSSGLALTLGRVPPSDLLVKDSEVSGKHARINWNSNKLKWELVDMGSLNGTYLNSRAIHHHLVGSRHWGDPVEIETGDTITLGTTSKISVQIESRNETQVPLGVGVASDPMALRRGARQLPMEDVCYYRWPLPGREQFGLFGICDGHGGVGAATSVSQIIPDMVANILSDPSRRQKVLVQHDASDVLREAFSQTEASIDHYYEGCTATALLVWMNDEDSFFAQCANLGDSACIINNDGKLVKLTEDHRVCSQSERLRIQTLGKPLRDGENRICGLNLARMFGDKFLKQQDDRFSTEPYISEPEFIHRSSQSFAVIASDGFWDVINAKKAVQLVNLAREKQEDDRKVSPEKVANILLEEARTQRTRDNTSVVFLDFSDSMISINSCRPDL